MEWPRAWYKRTSVGRIFLSHVIRIQKGQKTAYFDENKSLRKFEEVSFSLMYGSNCSKSIDFVAPSAVLHQKWFDGLKCLIDGLNCHELSASTHMRYVNAKWDLADRNGDGSLSKKEIFKLLHSMNISMSKSDATALYEKVDTDKSNSLSFQEFCELLRILCRR